MSSLFDNVKPPAAPPPAEAATSPAATRSGKLPTVLVEPQADGQYVVSRLRDGGTTSAAVLYTRAELEELYARIPPALAVGG